MSDVDANPSGTDPSGAGDKNLIDKAKDAASDIDVEALMGKAKVVASDLKDRSVDAAVTVKGKVSDFVGSNEERIGSAIEKTGHFVDDKLTGQRFSDKIDKAQEVAKGAVHKVGAAPEAANETPTAAVEPSSDSK